ncbi:hypothetical protein ACFLUR_01700 [Chloroflexota bacterium]
MKFVTARLADILSGFVFWLPIGISILIGGYFYNNLEVLGKGLLVLFVPEKFLHPGLGTLLWLIIFLLTGLILKNTAIGEHLSRIPVIGLFFREKGGKVITVNRLLNLTPCLFLFSPTCPSYGWILSEEEIRLDEEKVHFTLINVYYPNVPSIVTGQIFPVRKESVIKLGNQSREIIDLLLYALRSPENIIYLPWEEEKEEEFKKRAEDFGVKLSTD